MTMHARMRGAAGIGAAFAFILALGLTASAQVAITINGLAVNVSPEPMIQAGRVFVPLRGVFENLGATVVYSNGQINATGNGREISLQIGSTQASVNGANQTLDVAPFIVGASTYVPLRFVSQALGASVSWDNNDQTVAISLAGAPQAYTGNVAPAPASYDDTQAYEENDDFITEPPPPIPYYEQPPVPAPNYIWMPGYWAWGGGGYYWVPGTWVQAPQPQYVWTPGYWGFSNGYFGFHPGYWATQVGFYGGVNYGAGYYGNGYAGGRWQGNTFRYNTAVTRVTNVTIIRNVYVDKTVVVNNTTVNRVSYNGGPHGITARPTATDLVVARAPHVGLTPLQKQHIAVASQDRGLLATVNRGKPPITVAPKPFTPAARPAGFTPITTTDRATAQKLVVRPAVARPAVAPTTMTRPEIARPSTMPRPEATLRPDVPATARPVPSMMVRPSPPPALATRRPLPVRATFAPHMVRATPVPPALRPQIERPVITPRPIPVATTHPAYANPPVRPAAANPPVRPAYANPPVRPVTANPPARPAAVHTPMPARPPVAAPRPPVVAHPPVVPKPHPTEPPPH